MNRNRHRRVHADYFTFEERRFLKVDRLRAYCIVAGRVVSWNWRMVGAVEVFA